MAILPLSDVDVDFTVPVLIVGAGACGLAAALASAEAGAGTMVLERDPLPSGNTTLSQGLIPAAGSRVQRESGVADSPEAFAADILAKAKGQTDAAMVGMIARESGPLVDWLIDSHGLDLHLVDDFLYPGHSFHRMHGPAHQSGRELEDGLLAAVERLDIDLVTDAQAADVYVDAQGSIGAVGIKRPDGTSDIVGCDALVLACNGFGDNPDLVARHIPEAAGMLYVGHRGNDGLALLWGEGLGAATADLTSYQGHGSIAVPASVLLTWAVVTAGGIQINANGNRFADESTGYSEFAASVEQQPERFAWSIFDARAEKPALAFHDYQELLGAGAIREAATLAEVAKITGVPLEKIERTMAEVASFAAGNAADPLGRAFKAGDVLQAPYRVVRTVGSLLHTQGGLVVDHDGRVLRPDGTPLPNLFAGGGAARGISGPRADGYLAGNGLVTALVLGRKAGLAAASLHAVQE